MFESDWIGVAELFLSNIVNKEDFYCLCSRVFTQNDKTIGRNDDEEELSSESNEDDVQPLTEEEESILTRGEISDANFNISDSEINENIGSTGYISSDFNTAWEKYWRENGETLVWNAWINKYKDYINPDYLSTDAQKNKNTEEHLLSVAEKEIPCETNDFKKSDINCMEEIINSYETTSDSQTEELTSDEQWSLVWDKHCQQEYFLQYNQFLLNHLSLSNHEYNDEEVTLNNKEIKNHSPGETHEKEEISNETTVNGEQHFLLNTDDLESHANIENNPTGEIKNETNVSIPSTEECINELEQMKALNLPVCFGRNRRKSKKPSNINTDVTLRCFEKISAAFDLLGIYFDKNKGKENFIGHVKYKINNIRYQNSKLKMHSISSGSSSAQPKHIYFEDSEDDNNEPQDPKEQSLSEEACSSKASEAIEEINIEKVKGNLIEKNDDNQERKKLKRKRRKRKAEFPPEIESNQKLKKYWFNRFSLFSKFDQGIKLDPESWFSVSPEKVAINTAKRCKCDVIVDAFCGAGGNTIQFAFTCKRVIAIDIDPTKIELVQNNARVYGVLDRIEFIVGDFFHLADKIKADVVFLSPPWGGPSYLNSSSYDLEKCLQPKPISKLLETARQITENVAVFLPKNSDTFPLTICAGKGKSVEIEQNFLNKHPVAITAYYGDLIRKNDDAQ